MNGADITRAVAIAALVIAAAALLFALFGIFYVRRHPKGPTP